MMEYRFDVFDLNERQKEVSLLTSALNDFIQDLHFYNFQPSAMRAKPVFQLMLAIKHMRKTKSLRLDNDGSMLNVTWLMKSLKRQIRVSGSLTRF